MHPPTITAATTPDGHDPTTNETETHTTRSHPADQTDRANFIITAWLALKPTSRDACLARLIAATLHDGPGSALERFAASGELDGEAALAELNDVVVPIEREPWLDALGRYIITSGDRS